MENFFTLIGILFAGFALGVFFFGGLWYTVQKAVGSRMPALWFIGSFVVRVGVTLTGFYLLSSNQLYNIMACTAGFVLARFFVKRATRQSKTIMETVKNSSDEA